MKISVLFQLALMAAGIKATPAGSAAADKKARLRKCVAARNGTMDMDLRTHTMSTLASNNGETWAGITLPGQRSTYFYREKWERSDECYDHCTKACLIPAASYGFDAAYCSLDLPFFHRCIIGYTPGLEEICNPNDRGEPCPLFEDNTPIKRFDVAYLLRDKDNGLAFDTHPPYLWPVKPMASAMSQLSRKTLRWFPFGSSEGEGVENFNPKLLKHFKAGKGGKGKAAE